MLEIRYTRNLFLRGMSIVYLFAFTSFYVQIPGLYGREGILPARTQLEQSSEPLTARLQRKPTLLWFAPLMGIEVSVMMELLALFGIVLSFTAFVSQKFCSAFMFLGLWSLYYSLYQVGQTFMWFQWDLLLLEAGFLSALAAPLRYGRRKQRGSPADAVAFWPVRWLLFRLMFSSGVVKLTSGCPQWWGLTALSVHFESQCLPTALAWFAHHLPSWLLQLSTVFANVAELGLPLLFFVPVKAVRVVAFYAQVFLQVAIILTGNYNFFNLLTVTLCFSLLDDSYFIAPKPLTKMTKKERAAAIAAQPSKIWAVLSTITTLAIYAGVVYATVVLFGITIGSDGLPKADIAFTRAEFDHALGRAVPAAVAIGAGSLALATAQALTRAAQEPTAGAKAGSAAAVVVYAVAAAGLFALTTVPFSTLHPATGNATVLPSVRHWHSRLDHLHLANAYGLFRSMTGVGGRPEVIVEASNHLEGPWVEVPFKYKPGNVNGTLAFVAPHQPRLDWQMWFAALGTYHQNPWLMSLAYRILEGQSDVKQLLDTERFPFPNKPPKYVRASLYTYHYTPWAQRSAPAVWTRERRGEYFPVFSRDHPPLLDYLRGLRVLPAPPAQESPAPLQFALAQVRVAASTLEPNVLCWALLSAGAAILLTTSARK